MPRFDHPNLSGQSSTPARESAVPDAVLNSLLALRGRFLSFLERRVNSRAVAEDILQSAYLRALESEASLPDDESAVAWFYRILRNAVIDSYRRRTAENTGLERFARELETETSGSPLLEPTTCQCVAGALDLLTPAYADLIRTVDLNETPLADYAASQQITPGNAAVRAHRARAALRKQLTQCCGSCATHGCLDCDCRQPAQ